MRKKKIFGSIIILSIFLIFLFVGYRLQNVKVNSENNDMSIYKENKPEYADKEQNDKNNETQNIKSSDGRKEIKAQIYGEIKKPGVYSLKNGDRIKDLIDLAGGFTEKSDTYSINGAKKVADGDNIEIKSKENKLGNRNNNDIKNNSSSNSLSSNNENEKLDINSASEDDIINKKIPGIAKGMAKKIVDYRNSNDGRINSQKDLEKAVGPKRAEKLMEYIEIN